MDMQGNRHLAVTQQQAWEALNDPEVLKTCIPGCDKVEAPGENQYAIGMAVKIGPVSARFAGRIQLLDVQPPTSYTLNFEGQGGAAGFGKGNAKVNLAPGAEGHGCELAYTAQAQVGGKIAQVGQRLVDGVAKSMAEDFFRRFDVEMQRRFPEAYAPAEEALAADAAGSPSAEAQADAAMAGLPVSPIPGETLAAAPGRRMPLWAWGIFGVVVVVALLLLVR
jgi:carbon monoxide dehydrogenase subunit G